MKKIAVLFSFLLIIIGQSVSVYSQKTDLILENGVSAHKEIDAIYRQFSEAYVALDAEKVTNLYAADAAYLPPDSEILKGREQIRLGFQSFFDRIKKEGRTMTISFRIFQRKVEKNLGYDVGIYTITQFKDGKQIGKPGKGKFIVVAVKEKDGKWRFQVDGYNNLKPENTQQGVENLTLDKEIVFLACPGDRYYCTEDKQKVKIETLSQDAVKNNLNYYYIVSGGKIIGQGANVVWDFSKDERPGKYTITAGVGSDDIIRGKTITKIIELKECNICDMPCECQTINVTSSKKTVYKGETVEFTANPNGGNQDSPTFKWTIENGVISEGQGMTKIKVQALSGETVTATVEMGGLCAMCGNKTDSESVKIIK
jgi:uncharacterized protein (TIGR02246 family)